MILDQHQRPLRNLRVSVTDRCNLRCSYCMPEAEYVWLPREDILHFEEVDALVGVFVSQVGGRPFTHHASILLPALALAALEALCVLVGYLAVGWSLGLRGHRRGSAERARA